MPLAGEWLEIRSTAPGVLGKLGSFHEDPPANATTRERVFSVVVDDHGKKTRSLPSLYHGRAQIFAHRDVGALRPRLERALQVIEAADREAAYQATACRVGGVHGIYTRDLFNRSSYRLHLSRLGVEFADDPYVTLMPSGWFKCADWGEFEPRFLIAGGPYPQDDEGLVDKRGGLVPFFFGILRVGQIAPSELVHLAKFVRRAPVLSSRNAQAVVEAVRAA